MSSRTARWKPFALCALVGATVFAFALTSQVGANVAQTSDQAASAYATTIAKAKEKRAAKLKSCNKKPTKAKRAACKKAANQAFKVAKGKAQEKRDEARNPGPSGGPPSSPTEEAQECIYKGGDPRECKEDAKGHK